MALLELDNKVYKIPNKVMKAFEDMSDYINDLKEENKTLKELNVCVGCDNNPDYKSRIDKAIEELKTANTVDIDSDRLCEIIEYVEFILKGEKNEI
jgi:hypothetical protein